MKINKKKLKSIVFAMMVAAGMLLPVSVSAQETADRPGGLFGTKEPLNSRGLFGIFEKEGEDEGITNDDFGEQAPLGSGIAILLATGLGYVALKKKEDEQ